MIRKGESWNESKVYYDPLTLRRVRRVTCSGQYNNTPTYHTNTAFTQDSEYIIFASAREGRSAIYRCHVSTGEITCLIDPVDGIGGREELMQLEGPGRSVLGNGKGVDLSMCIAPRKRLAVYCQDRSIRVVHIDSLQEHILIDDIGENLAPGAPSIDPEEMSVIVPVSPIHGDLSAGKRVTRKYRESLGDGVCVRFLSVHLEGGKSEVVFEDPGYGCSHCPHCPTDGDLLLIDRDLPPDRRQEHTRCWLLRLSTGELSPLKPRNENVFQMHAAWTWDGQNIVYHGPASGGGWFIGVISKVGKVVREFCFPEAPHYGHVAAMAGRDAVILDGNFTSDLLLWLYYDRESPRLEIIARHGADFQGMPGQYCHPHPQSDLSGKWISFNAVRRDFGAGRGHSDVFIVEIEGTS